MLSLLGIACAAPLLAQTPADDAVNRPLVVNGREIATDEIRRELVLDVGQPVIDGILSRFFVEHRADVAKLATPVATFEPARDPTEQEIAIVLRDETEYLHSKDPSKIDAWMRRVYHSVDWYPRVMRDHLRFNSVFLPNDVDQWADVTVEAAGFLELGDPHEVVASDLDVFRERATESGEPLVAEQSMWWPLSRAATQTVWSTRWNMRTALDGLPCEQVISIDMNSDGEPDWVLTTSGAWREVADGIDPCEVSIARRWLAAVHAIREQLERDGVALDAQPAAKSIAELERLRGSPCTHVDRKRCARVLGFPSALAYHEYRDLEEAIRSLVQRELAQDPPGRWAAVYNAHGASAIDRILGGETTVEFLLVAAFDSDRQAWKSDGWRGAAARAATMSTAVKASESNANAWDELVTKCSELWEPAPVSCLGQVFEGWTKRPWRTLHDWMRWDESLGESAYTRIANGVSLVDHVRYEQPVGTIDGPFRGPGGYYFARVIDRKPARRKLEPGNSPTLQRIRDECFRLAMLDYAREALAQADVRGIED